MHHTQVPLIGGLLCHPQSSVSRVAGERCHGAEEKWEVANVHRLHNPQQGLSEGRINTATH